MTILPCIWEMTLEEFAPRAWPSDAYAKLGGWMSLAGIDPEIAFMPKRVLPERIGMRVKLAGLGSGRIDNCLSHPTGYLMFDVVWDKPVRAFLVNLDYSITWIDRKREWKRSCSRFSGRELHHLAVKQAIADGKPVPQAVMDEYLKRGGGS